MFMSAANSLADSSPMTARSILRTPGRNRSVMAYPSSLISMSTLRRSCGLGTRRIHPRRSRTSRMLVMVADERKVRSLISLGVSGRSAPSMTARVLSALSGTPIDACIARSISS